MSYFFALFIFICALFASRVEANIIVKPDSRPIHEAFAPKFTDPIYPNVLSRAPPPPQHEQTPPKPGDNLIWIPGYWAWSEAKSDFTWVCGVWRRPPPTNPYWISGSWINQQNGWSWMRGFFSAVPEGRITLIEKNPPNSIDDQVPEAPGSNYFWIPGYWEYSQTTRDYSWLSGKWEAMNKNWILAPATYIWRGSGYAFNPMYWDWPLDRRGQVYQCSGPGSAPFSEMTPQMVLQELFIYYPNYITLFCHSWHFYPDWWAGCSCTPPWWYWPGWWSFCWGDMWGLWWWWGHPGFIPPFWITVALSSEIQPPPNTIINAFKQISKPEFPIVPGTQPLLPQGSPGIKAVPKPHIPNDITPGGQVRTPSLPQTTVTPPPPPQVNYPTTPNYQPSFPTQNMPPSYTPPPPRPLPPNYPQADLPPQYPYPNYPNQPQPNTPINPRQPPIYIPPERRPDPDYRPQYPYPQPNTPINPNLVDPNQLRPQLTPSSPNLQIPHYTPQYPSPNQPSTQPNYQPRSQYTPQPFNKQNYNQPSR